MGTDIHINIFAMDKKTNEYKELKLFKNDGVEIGCYAPYENRNYDLFGVLANIRGTAVSFTDVRGYPDWMPEELLREYDDGWYHSATWYDWVELQAYAKTDEAFIPYWWEDENDEDNKYNVLEPWLKDIRFVLDCYGIWYIKPGDVIITICFDS